MTEPSYEPPSPLALSFCVLLGLALGCLWALPLRAQSRPTSGHTHPSATHRPAIVPTVEYMPDGSIVQTWEVHDLVSTRTSSTIVSEDELIETQLVLLRGFPEGTTRADWRVFVEVQEWRFTESYGCENLTDHVWTQVSGSSAAYCQLVADHPVSPTAGHPDGPGVRLGMISLGIGWDVGHIGAWDGAFDFSGTSGRVKATTYTRTGSPLELTYSFQLERFERATIPAYVTPTRWESWGHPAWDLGVKCDLDGKPLDPTQGVGQGHAGLWPTVHDVRQELSRWRVTYEPR